MLLGEVVEEGTGPTMLRSFTYRLYPTKRQQRLLSEQLEELRWLWNTLLAERKIAWEERQEAVLYYDQQIFKTYIYWVVP